MSEPEPTPDSATHEPVQLAQIRQWEAGELYPEHETFSFGHGFGAAIVEAFDLRDAILRRLLDGWVPHHGTWEVPGYRGPEPMTAAERAFFDQ